MPHLIQLNTLIQKIFINYQGGQLHRVVMLNYFYDWRIILFYI